MKRSHLLPAARLAAGFAALCLFAACQSPAPQTLVVEAVSPAQPVEPVAVATQLDTAEPEGPVVNQWGGIVPDAKPTTPVENGALGEIE
ncbi:hypothetical protein [Hyphomonas sp.]|jgi:hypothetical protein|uniref:hypothetical protein n=1 Tax=Hyphomonas sp. TaxID=87 RepID=UPI0025BEEE09|nr:hypothetical protein [Hyphomonas sp.]|tara:strand:- start:4 stop:270 length:267 start_codon:yes stop_codon:yes gene_type:complete